MSDRYRGYSTASRSSAAYNPARLSLPTGVGGYGGSYTGETVTSPTRYASTITPRGYTTAAAAASIASPSRAYTTVNPEPRSSRTSTREPSRNRRSTVDASARPPIIVTTMQDHRPHAASSSTHPVDTHTHSGSPVRDTYRSSDGKLYAQPASSIRSRSTNRPYHTSTNDDFGRSQDQGEVVLASRDADAYRSSRPHVVYPSNPRHSNAAIDYGDDGYQYTNAGELVRYDLDHGTPSRSRRHESFDRAYSRPNVNYNADQRSFNVNTTNESNRTSRQYEGRGPPPSIRGFDKLGRYDNPRDVPPVAPIPPAPSPGQLDSAPSTTDQRSTRRPRPVSPTQEPSTRTSHPEDYYRSYDGNSPFEPRRFQDESVTSRGFGIRVDPIDDPEDPHRHYWDVRDDEGREEFSRIDEPRRRGENSRKAGHRLSDEDATRESDLEREEWYRSYKDDRQDRQGERRVDDQEDGDHARVREKLATGLGIAPSALVLPLHTNKDEKGNPDEKPKRRGADDGRSRDGDWDRLDGKQDAEAVERSRRDTEARISGEAAVSSESEDGKKASRRHRPSGVFDPNDTSDLKQLKEQLAGTDTADKDKSEANDRGRRSVSPMEDGRSRDLVVVKSGEEKQVRVVSPPREKKEDKPLKGILKQPSAKFPEEVNPIREGVAPHKEDKKLKEVPSGARWTKINRKIVNPEALEIGKERFEVRDDFVIVLRVLNKEEIQAYAAATQVLRERRRNKENGDRDSDRDRDHDRDHDREYEVDYDREYDEERGRRGGHRHRRHRDEADTKDQERDHDRDRERRRRHKRETEDEYETRSKDVEHRHPHRSHRET